MQNDTARKETSKSCHKLKSTKLWRNRPILGAKQHLYDGSGSLITTNCLGLWRDRPSRGDKQHLYDGIGSLITTNCTGNSIQGYVIICCGIVFTVDIVFVNTADAVVLLLMDKLIQAL